MVGKVKASQFHHELTIDKNQRVFFVGDIHGCYDTLLSGLKQVSFDSSKDVLISTGDLVDRGNKCYEVVQFFNNTPSMFSVLGNHDNFCLGRNYSHHINQGGKWFYFDTDAKGKEEIRDYFSSVPYCMTVHIGDKKIAVTHAEINPYFKSYEDFIKHLDEDYLVRESAIWDREAISYEDTPPVVGVDWSVHGHTFTEEPYIVSNRLYIDTGCVFSDGYEEKYLTFAEYKPSTNGFNFYKIENCENSNE